MRPLLESSDTLPSPVRRHRGGRLKGDLRSPVKYMYNK